MNETPNEPNTPPRIENAASPTPAPAGKPINQDPLPNLFAEIEAMLREPARVVAQLGKPGAGGLIFRLLVVAMVSALVYGVVVGTFSGGDQLWAAPVKIAGGLLVSSLICLPSLYIFVCLSGGRVRLVEVVGIEAGMLVLMTVLLIGFAPVAWLFSSSTESETWMGFLHLVFFIIAVSFGVRFLKASLERIANGTLSGVSVWTIIFIMVMLQMTTALRPIVGTDKTFLPTEKKFFISHWFDELNRDGNREGAR